MDTRHFLPALWRSCSSEVKRSRQDVPLYPLVISLFCHQHSHPAFMLLFTLGAIFMLDQKYTDTLTVCSKELRPWSWKSRFFFKILALPHANSVTSPRTSHSLRLISRVWDNNPSSIFFFKMLGDSVLESAWCKYRLLTLCDYKCV